MPRTDTVIVGADRQVALAAGRHTRLPRRYRGQDILWWLDRTGAPPTKSRMPRPPTRNSGPDA